MNITVEEIVVWLIVGALAGSLAGMIVKRKREGFGSLLNLAVGFVGAFIGGVMLKVFKLDFGLEKINISLNQVLAALIGSLLFLILVWFVKKLMKSKAKA